MRRGSLDLLLSRQIVAPGVVRLSKSQLSRYERGQILPPLKNAVTLDQLYDANGWVEASLRSLWRSRWDPWHRGDSIPGRIHALSWPAQYAGVVWIKLVPPVDQAGDRHEVRLDWGPWTRRVEATLDAGGAVLITGKATDSDGVAVILNLTSDLPVFVLHGVGESLDHERILDIRQGWKQR